MNNRKNKVNNNTPVQQGATLQISGELGVKHQM